MDNKIKKYNSQWKCFRPSKRTSRRKQSEALTVKAAQTNMEDFTPQVPEVHITFPPNEFLFNSANITVRFDAENWNVGGKGDKHIHFHIDNVPGLSFSDHLMFYNSPDNVIELNTQAGTTPFAVRISENTIQFNNIPNGLHKIRAHLADESHSLPANPEADTTIEVIVSSTDNVYGLEGNDSSGMDDDAILGDPNALVTMIEFADYQGPFGFRFFDETLPLIRSQYIDTGKVKFVFRDFPLTTLFQLGAFAAEAAECVGEQGGDTAYFDMYYALFGDQEASPLDLADDLGYDITECLENGEMAQEVVQDYLDARAYGMGGTPSFLIDGELIRGAQPFSTFQTAIEQAINDSIACFADVDCDDFDVNTLDTCLNAGTIEAVCQNEFFTILSVNSPSGPLFDNRRIPFNITANEEVDEITYINWEDRRPRERRLCRDCDEYGSERKRVKSFSDGYHNITFYAIKNDEIVDMKNIDFRVDSRDPRISRTEPRRGFASGIFNVEFREYNPEKLILYYGNSIRNHTLDIESDCILDRSTHKCETEVNLSDFDGGEIEYWFELSDIVGNTDEIKDGITENKERS